MRRYFKMLTIVMVWAAGCLLEHWARTRIIDNNAIPWMSSARIEAWSVILFIIWTGTLTELLRDVYAKRSER